MLMTDALEMTSLTLGQEVTGTILVNWFKPLLVLVLFLPWAIVVSRVYDKHAARFFLPRQKWNMLHIGAGILALVSVLGIGALMPGSEAGFWIGFGVALLILVGDLLAYMLVANKDDRVPERFRISLRMGDLDEDKKKSVKKDKNAGKVKLAIRGADEKGKFTKLLPTPAAETPELEVRVASEGVYEKFLRQRALQVDFAPASDGAYSIKPNVDGVFLAGENVPAPMAAKIMDFWKAAAGLDVADRRRRLQGICQVDDGTAKHTVKVISIGAQGGMKLSLQFDPELQVNKKVTDLGLLEQQMTELQAIVKDGKGVVLLTSPRDGGRTTTMYSVLRLHDAYINNVQTVEMDPQLPIEGVRINKFDPQGEGPGGQLGPEFGTLVRSIMRRDPQVVGVSELPDQSTAKEVAKADHERTRTYISFNAPDALSAIQAWVKIVGDARLAGECLHGVISGKLARKLCTNCRAPYPPSAEMLKKLGIPDGKVQQLFKKGGQVLVKNKPETCPMCQGLGYFGQEGVFEIATISREERELISAGNFTGLKSAFRKRGIPTAQQVAIRKSVDGITSVEEVMRVTTDERPQEAAPSASGGAKPAAPAQSASAPAAAKPASKPAPPKPS